MLVLGMAQLRALGKYARGRFEDRMVVHLQQSFPAETRRFSQGELRATICNGIDRAALYGVKQEDGVKRYLELMFQYTLDFDSNARTAWAGKILRATDLDGPAKIDRIDQHGLFAPRRV